MSRTLLLRANGASTITTREQLVHYITKVNRPKPGEPDAWSMGVFREDPDEDNLTRKFFVYGSRKDCAEAVAGYLSRHTILYRAGLRIVSFQGEVDAIDCRSTDFSF